MSGGQATLLLVLVAFIALMGLAMLAALAVLVRVMLRMERRVTSEIDQVRAEVVATAEQVRETGRQVGVVLNEMSRGARYATMAIELWRLARSRSSTQGAAPALRRSLLTRVGVPLGMLAVRAISARLKSGPPRTPDISG